MRPIRAWLRPAVAWLLRPVDRSVYVPLLITIAAVAAAVGIGAREFLPGEFFTDGQLIERIATDDPFVVADRKFRAVGQVFSGLLLTSFAALPTLFSFAVGLMLVLESLRAPDGRANRLAVAVGSGILVLFIPFMSWYSKESLAAATVAAFLVISRKTDRAVLAAAPLVVYGLAVRDYWVLIAAAYVAVLIVERYRRPALWRLLLTLVGGLLVTTVGYRLAIGGDLQGIRVAINQYRDPATTESMIVAPVAATSLLTDWAGTVGSLGILLAPVPLVLLGSVYHLASAGLISAIWLTAWVGFTQRGKVEAVAPRSSAARSRAHAMRAFYLLAAYVSIQAIFEPDYGSYLRHLVVVLPCICAVWLGVRATPARPAPVPSPTQRDEADSS